MHAFQPQAALGYEYVNEVTLRDENLEAMCLPQDFLKIRNVKLYHSVNQTFVNKKANFAIHNP